MNASSERGQTLVVTVVSLVSLLAMAVAVLDVGSWFREDRAAQAAADAAALAAAQELPEDPALAVARAQEYAAENGGGLAEATVSSRASANDTISTRVARPAPGFFARLFGIESVTVDARAAARAAGPAEAKYVAPIVVNWKHPLMPGGGTCKPDPCFGTETELELAHLHKPGSGDAAGAFGLINLHRDGSGSVGSEELAAWMARGFDQYMPLGVYQSVPSTMFNSSHFGGALGQRVGDDVLFPIYNKIVKGGSTAEYTIIGWVGFRINSFDNRGSEGKIRGYFTKVIWQGIQSEGGDPSNGVKTIALVD